VTSDIQAFKSVNETVVTGDVDHPQGRIASNLSVLHAQIDEALAASGRKAGSVKLVAVSKTVSLTEIAEAIAAGQTDFAENRTNLFKERQAAFPEVDWHFIGRIQTNKIKDFVGKASLVHSVASSRVLAAIEKTAAALDIIQPVLIEVNVSGEESKDGINPSELPVLLEAAAESAHIRVDGLMTMAPIADDDTVRHCFASLRQLQSDVKTRYAQQPNLLLNELSMGMSDDFLIAISEGATIIRLGRIVWR